MQKTWEESAERWHRMGLDRAGETIRREAQLLRWLYPHLATTPLEHIRAARILDLRQTYRDEGQSPRSCNYLVGLIRSVLTAAYEWGANGHFVLVMFLFFALRPMGYGGFSDNQCLC